MQTKDIPWKTYERLVAGWCSEWYSSTDISVTPNAKIIGKISGVYRQVDVLIDTRFESCTNRRIIVDAKRTHRKIDIKDIEEFEGMMRDCSATHGILVCINGYTDGAKRRSQDLITLTIKTADELSEFNPTNWDTCSSDTCSQSADYGLTLWSYTTCTTDQSGLMSIYSISKCDKCRQFSVWCWGCGQIFSMTNEDEFKCRCESSSFWLTAIEEDEDQVNQSVYLFLIFPGVIYVVDRKALT
jgi:hypothetical protein